MRNPAEILPATATAIQGLYKAIGQGGLPQATLELVHLRASQINGCSACLDAAGRAARKAGVTDEQLWSLAGWREAPYFSDAQRAALALTEYATRLSDRTRPDAVPDEVWAEAADHYDDEQLAALILMIATANLFNRINTTIKEPAGRTWG